MKSTSGSHNDEKSVEDANHNKWDLDHDMEQNGGDQQINVDDECKREQSHDAWKMEQIILMSNCIASETCRAESAEDRFDQYTKTLGKIEFAQTILNVSDPFYDVKKFSAVSAMLLSGAQAIIIRRKLKFLRCLINKVIQSDFHDDLSDLKADIANYLRPTL